MQTDIHAAIRHITKVDPVLAPVIKEAGEHMPYRIGTAFDGLIRIVTAQQLNGKIARAIFSRIRKLNNNKRLTVEFFDRTTDKQLKSAGLSANKIRAVRSIAAAFKGGSLNPRRLSQLSDEQAFNELVAVKGIGPWTANIYLMFVLRRPDVFPSTDLGIITTMRRIYGIKGTQEELHAIAEKWQPYRSIGSWYIWQAGRTVTPA